ncbi:thioesterase [Streptomyces sp. PT12]|nr:thioesterase [Streptomyces sp. PT12]
MADMVHTVRSVPVGTATGTADDPRAGTARLRLFCFHHAGGSPWSFAGWGRRLGLGAEVVPVTLPPRSVTEVPGAVSTMDALVREVTRQLTPFLAERYAFYGHSMGALVAYGVAQRQAAEGRRVPDRLVVGAHRAPHLPPALPPNVGPSDRAVLELLLGLGGAGRLLRENPRRIRAVTTRLREDLRVCATYRHPAGHRPLPSPIHVLFGTHDPLVSAEDAAAWRAHTSARFTLRALPGGHFFPQDDKELFFAELSRVLGTA